MFIINVPPENIHFLCLQDEVYTVLHELCYVQVGLVHLYKHNCCIVSVALVHLCWSHCNRLNIQLQWSHGDGGGMHRCHLHFVARRMTGVQNWLWGCLCGISLWHRCGFRMCNTVTVWACVQFLQPAYCWRYFKVRRMFALIKVINGDCVGRFQTFCSRGIFKLFFHSTVSFCHLLDVDITAFIDTRIMDKGLLSNTALFLCQ